MKMIRIYILLFISSVYSISIDIRYPQFFHQYDSIVEIAEGKTAGSFIAFINLINYTNINLTEWILNTTNEDFQIQSNGISYSLITTQILDRERQNFYNFSIDAQHVLRPFEKLSKNVYIRILDINDCIPSFNQTIYQTTLIPFTIQAYDCDEPNTENSRISYSLSNYQDIFHINETTGLIQCNKNLNTYERYEVIVVAYDHGKPSLSSTTLVQIQLISSKFQKNKSSSWLHVEQKPENILILAGILSSCFVFLSLFLCLICSIKYKIKRRRNEKKFSSSTSSISSSNDYQEKTIYDAINIFPNTLYLPVKQHTSSTTSSPISTTDITGKIGSDDGCYCSSDMSSDQSNNILLLNPSSLTTKHVRFNSQINNINGVLQRFENLYGSHGITDHCASYV
jgi:hypothetical protein